MKRSFPPSARQPLCVLVGALTTLAACSPDNDVEAGAPVLQELTLIAPGPTAVTVTADTPDCQSGLAGGEACDPSMNGLCRQNPAGWCSCVADAMDMTMGSWDCTPFPVLGVVAVFDRLLDTAPFDAVYPEPSVDVITATAGSGEIEMVTDYASTGTPTGITPLFSQFFNGNFRNRGPSLFSTPAVGFPSDSMVMVALDAGLVQAKDGTTPFTGLGLLQSGAIVFTMPAFTATISPPDDSGPARVTFTNLIDTDILTHITVTQNNVDITSQVMLAVDGLSVTVTPMNPFPTGAVVVITVDATARNTFGQAIGAAKTDTFTAP